MSKLERLLWGLDFVISGVSYIVGGTYAGLLCFVIAGILILFGLIKKEGSEREGNGLPTTLLVDAANRPYKSASKIKRWHKWGTAIFGFALLMLISYGAIKYRSRTRHVSTTPTDLTQPFLIEAENSFPGDPPDAIEKSPLWETTNFSEGTESRPVRVPISCLVYFRIANLQSYTAVITDLSIEVMTSEGWKRVIYWDRGPIFWVAAQSTGMEFANATEIQMPMLDAFLRERTIGSKETIMGWLPLIWPRMNALVSSRKFRVTIADTLGGHTTVETGLVPAGNFTDSSFTVLRRRDISRNKLVLVQDMPEYWTGH